MSCDACRDMGIKTVAVYSEADKNAMHVENGRRSLPPSENRHHLKVIYDGKKIIDVAKSQVLKQFIPGYGFYRKRQFCS